MVQLLNLPEELIYRIAELLPAQDVFNFATTCSQLCENMGRNKQLWLRKSNEEWFYLEESYRHCFQNLLLFESECNIVNEDYMEYFAKRKRLERQVSDDIDRMTELGFSREYWEIFYKHVLNYDIVPYLVKIDSKYPVTELNAKDKISFSFLTAMRHNMVFKAMEKYSSCEEHLDSYENQLLLPLAAMDSSFFSLIDKRILFYNKCHRLLNRKMKNLEKIKKISPTLVVKQAIETLMRVVEETYLLKESQQGTIEEYFLPRVYSGESDPNELIIICILQEFARQLDIKITVANGALVIPDSLSPQGVTYLILRKKTYHQFEYQFLTEATFKDLINDMNGVQDGGAIVDFETATMKLSARDIYTEFLMYISQSEESAVVRYNEICQDPKLSSATYPISKFGIDPDEISFFGTFRKVCQLYETRDIRRHDFDVIERKFRRSMFRWYPMDLAINFHSIKTDRTKEDFLSTSLQQYLFEPYSVPLRRNEIIGKFVKRNENDHPSLVTNYDIRSERDCFELLAHDGKKYVLFAEVDSLSIVHYNVDDPEYHEFLTINKKQRLDYLFRQTSTEDNVLVLQLMDKLYT